MNVRVLLFSTLREKVGRKEMDVSVAPPVTAGELWRLLVGSHAALAPYEGTVRFAVNQNYVGRTHLLEDGDEVALITPVSGG